MIRGILNFEPSSVQVEIMKDKDEIELSGGTSFFITNPINKHENK